MSGKKNKSYPVIRMLFAAIVVAALAGAYIAFGPSAKTHKYLYIKTGSTYSDVLDSLRSGNYLLTPLGFDLVAKARKLPEHIRPGRYQITTGMSNFELVRNLRNGKQAEVNLVVKKLRTKGDFARLLSANLEIDSPALMQLINSPEFLSRYGLDSTTFMCAVLPNTYRFNWNSPFEKVFGKMHKNYVSFWNSERQQAAKDKGLTPVEATIIASIVEEETNVSTDKPNIASVYLNRLAKGMKLQADPTVKFAIGNFSIRRITGAMLKTSSPYNTYENTGLPPGPICTPETATIDAVLQAPESKYIYFCAKDDLSGASVFAETGEDHLKNARAYQKALNDRNIH